MSHHVAHDALAQLLIRIQGKIETRTRRPWFDLQRSYYFTDRSGVIKNVEELKTALVRFHVLLSEAEYAQLFASFPMPGNPGRFDFKAFAEKMYSRADKPPAAAKTVDGRVVATLFGGNEASPQQQQQQQQLSPQATQQQQAPRTPLQQPRFDGAGSSQTLSPQQQQIYEQRYYADQHSSPQRPIVFDSEPPQQQHAQDFSPNGTAATGQYGSPSNGRGSRASRGSRSRSRSPFKPRITYNRPAHARYVQSSFESTHPDPEPRPAPYPSQELFGAGSKPRFEEKKREPVVDVARRHNISAQARRSESPQKNGARR